MPKQVAEIKQFNSGIVATPDAKDIPADAADFSKDIETIASDGFLKGRLKNFKHIYTVGTPNIWFETCVNPTLLSLAFATSSGSI